MQDPSVLSKLTANEWQSFAGKVLAIDPSSDEILAVEETEEEIEAKHSFGSKMIEFFHVPAAGSLSAS